MTKWTRRLLVVEDTPLMAALMVESLSAAGFDVEASHNAVEGVAAVRSFDPDAVLIDIDLGDGPTGLDLAHRLHVEHPEIALIFLTKYPDPAAAGQADFALPPGSAYLSKDVILDVPSLVAGIEAALEGSPASWRHDQRPPGVLAQLTATQREVVRLAAVGYTNQAIADQRGTGVRAVELLLQSAFARMGIDVAGDMNPRVVAVRMYIDLAGVPASPGTRNTVPLP